MTDNRQTVPAAEVLQMLQGLRNVRVVRVAAAENRIERMVRDRNMATEAIEFSKAEIAECDAAIAYFDEEIARFEGTAP